MMEGWRTYKLSDVGEYINGYAFKPNQWGERGFPIIRIQNLNDKNKPYNYFDGYIESKYLIINDDILISWSASLGTFKWKGEKAWLNQHIFKAIPNLKLVDKDFFYFTMLYEIDSIAQKARGSTMRHVTKKEFDNSLIQLPNDKSEQKKIASILNKLQGAIEKQEAIIRTTTEIKKALLQKLFTEGLHGEAQKETEIGLVPESWDVVKIAEVAKVGNGSTPKRDNESYWKDGGISWLNSTKIHEFIINNADQFVTEVAKKECHLPLVNPNSLLMAITGQGKTLGNTAIVTFPTTINQHLAYIEFTTDKVHPKFMLWYLQTRYQHLRSIAQAGGSTKGALTCSFIKSYLIPLPAISEQKYIAKALDAIYSKEKFHQREKQTLTSLFKTLLHQLMTGQLPVNEIEFEQPLKEYYSEEYPLTLAAEV